MNIELIFKNHKSIPLFDVEISQEEGSFARAKMLIAAGTPLPPTGTEAIIQGKTTLFRGSLIELPVKVDGNFAEIECIAIPVSLHEDVQRIQNESRISPYWDMLYVSDLTSETEIQDAHTSSLYYDRRGGVLTRSDWFEGRHTLDISHDFFKDSLVLRIVRSPLLSCTLNIHAYWVQQEEGVENLSSSIRFSFPRGKVSTYTKNAIVEKWPHIGKRVGKSGVWVLKSELEETTPPAGSYPPYSPPIPLATEGNGGKLRSYRVKRHWFKPTLWVGWKYHQKRKETLSVTLLHAVQPLYPGEGERKVIDITLQNIHPDPRVYPWTPNTLHQEGAQVFYKGSVYQCTITHLAGLVFEEEEAGKWMFQQRVLTPLGTPTRASFFLTERGYEAADHAVERAKAILAKSARAIEVSFEASWEIVGDITTDSTISLADPRLPGGQIRGKVIHYAMIVKGKTGERFVRVTLACSIGEALPTLDNHPPQPTYEHGDYGDQAYQVHTQDIRHTPSGMAYFRYDEHQPPTRERGPLLRHIELINGPEEQEAEMARYATFPSRALKQALSRLPTRLRLYFRDLRTKERLDHLIPMSTAGPWASPRQVNLHSGEEQRVPS